MCGTLRYDCLELPYQYLSYRVAALSSHAVNIRSTQLYSVSFIRMQGKKVVGSIVILQMQAACILPSTTVLFCLAKLLSHMIL